MSLGANFAWWTILFYNSFAYYDSCENNYVYDSFTWQYAVSIRIVMSTLLETVDSQEKQANRKLCYSLIKNKHNRALKSRENIFKPKCNRELKKKLKKYKLRRDGIEDPDILDVSKILVSSLRIKSPNNQVSCNNNKIDQEDIYQGNYLIRMVRKKKICTDVEGNINNGKVQNEENSMTLLPEEIGDKKHMDAFKLMMEARNKSIGSNSPGKEKVEEQESKEIAERKEIKAKRNLSLQKLALSKGFLKNQEIEELRNKCIEKKLVKRAEKFKEMIAKIEPKSEQKRTSTSQKQAQPTNDKSDVKNKPKKIASLKLCDIFNETIEVIDHDKNSKKIPTEDVEFLKKLSPSIKKKENMLSYFQKIPKDDTDHVDSNCLVRNNESIIKVKFNSKLKKKTKILKVTDDINTASETVENKIVEISNSNELHSISLKRIKRKRNLKVEEAISKAFPTDDFNLSITESRPKRNVKIPLKYAQDVLISSSDEELHLFTPKKKKINEKPLKFKKIKSVEEMANGHRKDCKNEEYNVECKDAVLKSSKKDESKNKINQKKVLNHKKHSNNISSRSLKLNNDKAMKLAPIFVAKMQLSPADIEAKQKFLKSGVPEKLKKKVQNPTNEITLDIFPSVVHVQQSTPVNNLHQEKDWSKGASIDESNFIQNELSFKNLLTLEESCNFNVPIVSKDKPDFFLKSIKCVYPKFPVYRTYHLLHGKSKGEFKDCAYPELDNSIEIINGQCISINNENPDQLNWCDKYKPTSSKQIIGNIESIKELKKWLETWTENLFKAKQNASDSSDFSDFYHSDTDSRDTNRNKNNVLILTGQPGSGKTSSVYAVASELAIKVIEVNPSSKRTGKIMLQDLQEATLSHKVDRGKSGSDNSQKLQEEIIFTNKRGRPKKGHNGKHRVDVKTKQPSLKTSEMAQQILASQESIRTGMSLILIDDADIIFEQDDGFSSAIAQLIQSSKRPVILTASSSTCPHLQRFLQYGKVLRMRPVLSKIFGTWLDIMCLADVGQCCPGLGDKVLCFYRGDIRKTINCLQFYMHSNKHVNQGDEVALSQFKHKIDDEDSNMSWVESENLEAPTSNNIEVESYMDKQLLHMLNAGCPFDVFNIWWNVPRLYKNCNNAEVHDSEGNLTNRHSSAEEYDTEQLNSIAHVLDTITVADYFDHINPDKGTNISTRPWYRSENDSLCENENFECYNNSSLVTREISDVLLKSTITAAQRLFKRENSLDFPRPSMSVQRKRDKIVNRHNTLSRHLHLSAVLDHRATALDYWPVCRAICRIEKNRTDTNVRRKNRFCHYLKSLNFLGKNDFFDSLADSLT